MWKSNNEAGPAKRASVLLAALAAWLSFAGTGSAVADPASEVASPPGLPSTPTNRVLAIGHLTAKATPEAMRAIMPNEVRETVKLYLTGRLDQWFVRKDQPGVVFLLNTGDPEAARATLEGLPLGKAGMMTFDLIPLGPLSPLGLLLAPTKP